MGVFDAAAAAMTGWMDWNNAWGSLDHIRDLVAKSPDAMELHEGDGLFAGPHLASRREVMLAAMDEAHEHLEQARKLCFDVLAAL